MKEVKLVQQPDGSFAMQKAHHQNMCICPFATRLLVPGSVGNLQISATLCTTNCPHFCIEPTTEPEWIDEDPPTIPKQHYTAVLTCSGEIVLCGILNPEILDQPPTNELKIIAP